MTTQKQRATGAYTSFPNSPESDRQPQVFHDVRAIGPDGVEETVRLMAAEPGQAIDRVNRMSAEAYAGLPRVAARTAKNVS